MRFCMTIYIQVIKLYFFKDVLDIFIEPILKNIHIYNT